MYEPVQKCTTCGAGLTLDDLRVPNCKYCGTVLPHRAQAEQHAQLVGQVMGNMMAQQAQIQNAWRAGFGVPAVAPPPPGPPLVPPGVAPAPPGAQFGPYGAGGPYAPYGPYADPRAIAAASAAGVAGVSRAIGLVVGLVIALVVLVLVGGGAAAYFLAR